MIAILKRYAGLYLPGLIVGGLCVHIGLESLIPALEGEIPKLKGSERLIRLDDSPIGFWFEVGQRAFLLLMGPVVCIAIAWARRSDEIGDRLILQRFRRDHSLDKAVRRPLQPD